MKRVLFVLLPLLLAGCGGMQKLFTLCTADHSQCFQADHVKQGDTGCIVSEDTAICGPYTVHQNYFVPASAQGQNPQLPEIKKPAATPGDPVPPVRANP